MSDKNDPMEPRFFAQKKEELDDILSDIDSDLNSDVLDIETFDEPLAAKRPPKKSFSFGGTKKIRGDKLGDFEGLAAKGAVLGGSSSIPSRTLFLGAAALALVVAAGAGYYFIMAPTSEPPRKIAAPLAPPSVPMPPQLNPSENVDANIPPLSDVASPQSVPQIPNNPENSTIPEAPVVPETAPSAEASLPQVPQGDLPKPPSLEDAKSAPETAEVPATPTVPNKAVSPEVKDTETSAATPALLPAAPSAVSPEIPQTSQSISQPQETDSSTALAASSEAKTATKPSQKTTEKIKYFDAPPGNILEDIAPPSIDVSREPGGSIIIVEKPPLAMRSGGDNTVRIERSIESERFADIAIAADRALRLGRYDMALDFYGQILAQNPNDVSALLGRGIALQKTGQIQAAANTYRNILRRDPSNVTAATNLASINSSQSPMSAAQNLSKVLEQDPQNTEAKGQLGVSLAEAGNLEAAYQAFLAAAQNDPQNPQHFFNLAVTAERLNKRTEAISFYEKALEVDAIYGTGRGINRDIIYDRLSALRGR